MVRTTEVKQCPVHQAKPCWQSHSSTPGGIHRPSFGFLSPSIGAHSSFAQNKLRQYSAHKSDSICQNLNSSHLHHATWKWQWGLVQFFVDTLFTQPCPCPPVSTLHTARLKVPVKCLYFSPMILFFPRMSKKSYGEKNGGRDTNRRMLIILRDMQHRVIIR